MPLLALLSLMQRLLYFFQSNPYTVNIDSLFGLCALEGSAEYILEATHIPATVKHELMKLQHLSRHVVNNSLLHLKEINKDYNTVGFILQSSWKPHVFYQSLPSQETHLIDLSANVHNKKQFTEEQSDLCFQDAHQSGSLCKIKSDCLDLMIFEDSAQGYYLTHQVLYATLIESYGCHSVSLPSGPSVQLRSRLRQLCTRVHAEHLRHKLALLDGIGPLRHSRRLTFDLMLEQVFACGRVGFVELAADDRLLQALLAAQDPVQGCFKGPPPAPPTPQPLAWPPLRSFRAVHRLDGGCELHLTGVAACAASVYLMLLLDPAAGSTLRQLLSTAQPTPQQRSAFLFIGSAPAVQLLSLLLLVLVCCSIHRCFRIRICRLHRRLLMQPLVLLRRS